MISGTQPENEPHDQSFLPGIPGIPFPGKLKNFGDFSRFPGNKDPGSREFPGNSREFRLSKFPVSREMKKSGKMETLVLSFILATRGRVYLISQTLTWPLRHNKGSKWDETWQGCQPKDPTIIIIIITIIMIIMIIIIIYLHLSYYTDTMIFR